MTAEESKELGVRKRSVIEILTYKKFFLNLTDLYFNSPIFGNFAISLLIWELTDSVGWSPAKDCML